LAICCSIVGLLLTAVTAFSCWLVTVDLTAGEEDANNPLLPSELTEDGVRKFQDYSMGVWSRETTNIFGSFCVLYSSREKNFFFDTFWRASRAFALIAAVCGVVGLTFTLLHACSREAIINRNLLGGYCFVAAIQALVFLAYGSDICTTLQCNFSSGSTCAVVAIALYLLAGIFHFLIYKQETHKAGDGEAGVKDEEEEQVEEAKEPE